MQTLYALLPLNNSSTTLETGQKELNKHFENSLKLLLYTLQTMVRVVQYAAIDAQQRATKNLPGKEDLNVNISITKSVYLQSILSDNLFTKAVEQHKVDLLLSNEFIKKIYTTLVESDMYKAYIGGVSTDQQVFEYLLNNLLLGGDLFMTTVEEVFANMDDDIDVLYTTLKKYLQKPGCITFTDIIGKEKKQFATLLLQTVLEKDAYLSTLINPRLKNWDADRIAVLDMILLKMGVCEILYFETIPVKVTINEYIDIAKEYSTAQSGQFINGVLDSLQKELIVQNKIHKVDFKQS